MEATKIHTPIDSHELRIGNWIAIHYVGSDIVTPRKILEKLNNGVIVEFGATLSKGQGEPKRFFSFQEIREVPLTFEILKATGFISDLNLTATLKQETQNTRIYRSQYYTLDGDFRIETNPDDPGKFSYKDHDRSITGVHQLQNLYVDKTGRELKVRL